MVKFVNAVLFIALVVLAGFGIASIPVVHAQVEKEAKLAKAFDEFLKVPKDYRESVNTRADELVRNWDAPPTESQMELIKKEIAPRVNHIMANNGQFGPRQFEHYRDAIEFAVARAR